MKKTREKYTCKFKLFAVAASTQYGSVLYVAQELGISKNNLHRWKKLARDEKLTLQKTSSPDTKGNELSRLRKEIKDVRLERDILKKAPCIFSRRDGQDINLSGKTLRYFPLGRCAKFFR